MTCTESHADSENTAFITEHCGKPFHLEDDTRCRKRKRVGSVQPGCALIKCGKAFYLEDNIRCRRRKRVSSCQETSEAACNKVQDFIRQAKASCCPDLHQVITLTHLTTAAPTPAQGFTEPSTTSPVQDLFPTPQASPTEPSPGGVLEQSETPLLIHGYTVEEYQKIYHSVVDDMLKYKSGRPRPYTVQLGRVIKQRLWEKLNCPQISLQESDNGLLMVSELHEHHVYPPLIEVDISHEPDPREPSRGKKAKHC